MLLVLPVAIPDFVVGYAWHSFAPRIAPLLGATIVMTLGTYPLVYLPVAAALRRADPALEETARSLGVGRLATFARVTLPLVAPAVLGGAILVILTVISEYGAFEILRFQTFTTEIFSEFQFDAAAAGALSIPLVALGLLALFAEQLVPRRAIAASAPRRAPRPLALGRMTIPAYLGLGGLVGLGVGVPIGTLVYWMASSQHTTLPAAATLGAALGSTVMYARMGRADRGRGGAAGGDADVPAAQRGSHGARAQHVRDPGAARGGHRAQPGVLRDPLRVRAVPDQHAAGDRLRDPQLPAGAGLRPGLGGPDPAAAARGRALARARPDRGVRPRDAAAARARACSPASAWCS